jgi:ribosome biogenesis protein Nip4
MRAKAVTNFVSTFGVEIALNPDLTIEKSGRFYLLNAALKPIVNRDFFYAGVFLVKAKEGKFFPSFNLLSMLAKRDANRIVVERKAAWLFICGRDVLAKSVVRVFGLARNIRMFWCLMNSVNV